MKPTTQDRELISALTDGQLADEDFARALAVCEDDAEVASWNAYHLIGDVLRSPGAVHHAGDAAFVTRLRTRLCQEPGPKAAPAVGAVVVGPAEAPAVLVAVQEAANDAGFRWKWVAGFASLAAVVAVAWNTGAGLLAPSAAPQLAGVESAQQQVLVMSERGAVVRDARMEELLAAHKQFGGTSALQMPSGFLRNATFETTQDGRR